MAMCVTPCGVRGHRDPPRVIAGAVTRAPGSWGSGAVISPHKGDWSRHVLLQAACSPWGFLSLRKMRLRCGVSSVDRPCLLLYVIHQESTQVGIQLRHLRCYLRSSRGDQVRYVPIWRKRNVYFC
ncbi:uncharacterized protein GJ701_013239 [Geothlypis trichas]